MRRIERSVEGRFADRLDATVKYFPWRCIRLTFGNPKGHLQVGSLAGAAQARKDSSPDQRSTHAGQDSALEFKGISRLDGILNSKGCRWETRA